METEPHKPANPNHDEFEVAESLDDLDIDFTSGSGSSDQKNQQDDDQLPSIDDFTIDRQASATVKRVVLDNWYTQVLGQELGPFPFDELVNMVLGGDIGPKDMIRHQAHGEWVAAGDIGGLFPEIDDTAEDDDFELGSNVHVHDNVESAEAANANVRVVGGEMNRALREAQETRAKRNQAPPPPVADDDPIEPLEENLEIDEAPPEPTPEELEAARKKIIADRLNSWLDDRVETPPEPEVEEEETPSTPAYTPPAASYVPTQTPQQTYTPTPPRPMPVKPKVKSGGGESIFSKIGGMFGGVSAPDVSIDPKHMIALGAIALVAALFYLPSMIGGTNDEAIYQRFKEIYGQIQQQRSSNPAAIQAMKKDVVPEIEETVQKLLDDGAGAKKPIKQQLMWIGKNCLIPLIEAPGTEPGPLDTRIETHFSTIDTIKK